MTKKYTPNWDKLTPEQLEIVKDKGTERPFSGKLLHNKETGMYSCIVCKQPLFASDTKFESGSGWPSFSDVVRHGNVELQEDHSFGMNRTEVLCSNCGAHLGHMFNAKGYTDTGVYYCINSAALDFEKEPKE